MIISIWSGRLPIRMSWSGKTKRSELKCWFHRIRMSSKTAMIFCALAAFMEIHMSISAVAPRIPVIGNGITADQEILNVVIA